MTVPHFMSRTALQVHVRTSLKTSTRNTGIFVAVIDRLCHGPLHAELCLSAAHEFTMTRLHEYTDTQTDREKKTDDMLYQNTS